MQVPLFLDIADAPADGRAYWCETEDNTTIRFAVWAGHERGTVAILPGRGEYIEKYGRVVSQLVARGFSCIVNDWRGQGLSDRRGSYRDPGYIDDYIDYQADLRAIMAHPVVADLAKPLHLFAHSMGGAIAQRALLDGMNAKSAIFSAPMWGMGLPPAIRQLLKVVSIIADKSSMKYHRIWGTSVQPHLLDADFHKNSLTSDQETFDWIRTQLSKHPELGLGGPSWRWLLKSHEETAKLRKRHIQNIPVLTFVGTDETVVDVDAIKQRIASTKNAKLIFCDGAKHEVFMEKPGIQSLVWTEIDKFLSLNNSV